MKNDAPAVRRGRRNDPRRERPVGNVAQPPRQNNPTVARRQPCPLERYECHLPHDKLALLERARVELLAGVFQGPGILSRSRRLP
jgi:hypothetical protein